MFAMLSSFHSNWRRAPNLNVVFSKKILYPKLFIHSRQRVMGKVCLNHLNNLWDVGPNALDYHPIVSPTRGEVDLLIQVALKDSPLPRASPLFGGISKGLVESNLTIWFGPSCSHCWLFWIMHQVQKSPDERVHSICLHNNKGIGWACTERDSDIKTKRDEECTRKNFNKCGGLLGR